MLSALLITIDINIINFEKFSMMPITQLYPLIIFKVSSISHPSTTTLSKGPFVLITFLASSIFFQALDKMHLDKALIYSISSGFFSQSTSNSLILFIVLLIYKCLFKLCALNTKFLFSIAYGIINFIFFYVINQ